MLHFETNHQTELGWLQLNSDELEEYLDSYYRLQRQIQSVIQQISSQHLEFEIAKH